MNVSGGILLSLICAAFLAGCGGGGEADGQATPDEASRSFDELERTDSFQAANVRYAECMHQAGYPVVDSRDPEGILLKDGTRLKPEIGQSFALKGAYLEYTVDRERCTASSGVGDVMKEAGYGPSGPDPTAMNERAARVMRCVELKGWDVPEPVKLASGLLVFDVQLDAEQKSAYELDVKVCQNQLFGAGSAQSNPNP